MLDAPVPMTATRLPGRSTSWSQRGGVEDLALEGLDALDVGQLGRREPAGPGDERPGDLAAGGGDVPALVDLVPPGVGQLGVEGEPVERARLLRDPAQVGLDLRLRRERHRPVGVGREREGVQLARDVTRRAGVGVGAPRAADPAVLLDHEEVVLPGLGQRDRHTQPGEARADDEVVDGRRESPLLCHGARVLALLNIRQ